MGAPVLLTLDASVVLASATGERTVPLADFFTAYRQTVLKPDEVMREIMKLSGQEYVDIYATAAKRQIAEAKKHQQEQSEA